MQREYLFSIRNKLRKDPFYRDIKRPTLDWRRAFAGHQRRGQSTAAATPLAAGYNSAITLC